MQKYLRKSKTKGRKVGETYACSVCKKPFIMEHACQHICKRKNCKINHHKQLVTKYKKTQVYKKWSAEYGKQWYRDHGGKAWLKKWRDANRQKLNESQRLRRYGRPINKRGARAEAIKLGFRSMAEVNFAEWMTTQGIAWQYESEKIVWTPPRKKYTPDFLIYRPDGTFFFVEYKGRLTVANRQLLKSVKEQWPWLDLRIVFQNARKPINKGSKTTYGMWATQFNYIWAEATVPETWIQRGG